jgi:hypothetical protein
MTADELWPIVIVGVVAFGVTFAMAIGLRWWSRRRKNNARRRLVETVFFGLTEQDREKLIAGWTSEPASSAHKSAEILPFQNRRQRRGVAPLIGVSRYDLVKWSSVFVFIALLLAAVLWKEGVNPLAPSSGIYVTDGDTVRSGGHVYRLVGFDTPEVGSGARCERESALGAAATRRLTQLLGSGGNVLTRVPCACRLGTEGTSACNYGRLCARLTVQGRDVGAILISEGLARPFICGATSCPPRQGWCG